MAAAAVDALSLGQAKDSEHQSLHQAAHLEDAMRFGGRSSLLS